MLGNDKILDFITFPRTFEKYAWYKPLVVFIISIIFTAIIGGILIFATNLIFGADFSKSLLGGGIEGLNSALSIMFTDLILFMYVPSLYIASKIVGDRPFSSYSSSRGGWNFKLYLKAVIIPLILYVFFGYIDIAVYGGKGTYQFSIMFLIVLFITIPLQSIAEEYIFRGILMQTLGSWFKLPVIAIILQVIIFALAHGYNSFGFFEMTVNGLMWGFFTWKTAGIEVGSALHTANNFSVGLFIMLGMKSATSSPQLSSVLMIFVFQIIIFIIMYYVGNKTNWFGEIPENF